MRTVLVAVAVALALAGCSPEPDVSSPPAQAQPDTATRTVEGSAIRTEAKTAEGAKIAGERIFNAYAAGDWAGHWDEWSAEAQRTLPRADYARYHTTCKTITGLKFTVTSARLETADRAIVQADRGGLAFSYELRYETGRWRFQPDAEKLANYRTGVTAMIDKAKAARRCRA